MSDQREHFSSRLGFILMTAGCAIGLGNVWRFPYVAGKYGGGLFVLLYIICLLLFAMPAMLCELALGRAGQSTFPGAFRNLRNPAGRFKWEIPAYLLFAGNMILLMFYTVVTGWLLYYALKFISGNPAVFDAGCFPELLSSGKKQIFSMLGALVVTVLICLGGVRKTIEGSVKYMMGGLFLLLIVLVFQALSLDGAGAGVKFLLAPDLENFSGSGFMETLQAAMSQAFFTLSVGIGSVAICGSYIGKERSLCQEGVWIVILDTFVAVASGLIIFPSCMSLGIEPGAGPSLIFITLPGVFEKMPLGMLWGSLFFVFLFIAALSTLVAVFENLVAFGMDEFKWKRKISCLIFGGVLGILALPCIFGFTIWKNFQPLGAGSTILDLEDFIVSGNLLPLGAIYLLIFCMNKKGWGADKLFAELNTGKGFALPSGFLMRNYIKWIIPLLVTVLWAVGLWDVFNK